MKKNSLIKVGKFNVIQRQNIKIVHLDENTPQRLKTITHEQVDELANGVRKTAEKILQRKRESTTDS